MLFSGVGATGTQANFNNTVFDESATTPIDFGGPPFASQPNSNHFKPQQNLNQLLNTSSKGAWQLVIVASGATNSGTLNNWSLNLSKGLPNTGLGESVADQASASFRIFTMDPTNPVSSNTWTAVGPASVSGDHSGRIGGLAIDPSDPSGNTVYVAGASGGVWKTTNFLSPSGPTYIPLTDFGSTFGINIGGIAVFGRNNDPNQSIVFAATGEGDTGSTGVGFLRSMNGGATWTLLDSSTNVDSNGNELPMASPLRDHIFTQGTSAFKIAVDPTPTPSGQVIVYAALSGAKGGIWRSTDSGNTWQLMLAGQATDLTLDPASGTGSPNGNLQIVQAAIQGVGVFMSANEGQTWQLMAGNVGNPLIVNTGTSKNVNPSDLGSEQTPNGPNGRIVLAKPALTGDPAKDALYEGWLYAAVATPDSHLKGLYVTKDFGQNWTQVRIPTLGSLTGGLGSTVRATPTNDTSQADYDIGGGPPGSGFGGQANYDLSLAVDPTNPAVVYLGGTQDAQPTGLIRIDTTAIFDAHALVPLSAQVNDGGSLQTGTTGRVTAGDPTKAVGPGTFLNLLRNPGDPFGNATVTVTNGNAFSNTGAGVEWIPFDMGYTDQHRILTMIDPLTGHARIIIGDDQGVFTAVDNNGTFDSGIGSASSVTGSRNGNLQITQFYYGALQPSNVAAQVAQALFYGSAQDDGTPQSDPNVLQNGNISWTGPTGDASGVATDQTGSGTKYQYDWPCCGGNHTAFFQVNGTGKTFGLIQASNGLPVPDPQWPSLGGFNFAVNPISGQQIIMGSAAGRLFRTEDQGTLWTVVGDPSALDGSVVQAPAFGAPDPNRPGGVGNLDDFMYAGTAAGNIFVTQTGGGGNGTQWTKVSSGLDGSSVMTIIPDPVRGSHDAFAVTAGGTATETFGMNQAVAIGQGVSTFSTLNISDVNLMLQSLSLTVNITYPSPVNGTTPSNTAADLAISLIAPDGTKYALSPTGSLSGQNVAQTYDLVAAAKSLLGKNIAGTNIGGAWRLEVDSVSGAVAGTLNSWSLKVTAPGGVYYIPDSTVAGAMWHNITGNLFQNQIAPFGDTALTQRQLASIGSLAVDWRYVIPDTTDGLNSAPHPMLYVGGQGGVYRSTDDGLTWTDFPNQADGSPVSGGYLPNAQVTDLQIAIGNIDPTTGRAVAAAGDPNLLMATTYGRGVFGIRLAPLVFNNTNAPGTPNNLLFLDPASDTGTFNNDGITNDPAPFIDGLSEQTAFGNSVTINLFDHATDPNHLHPIGTGVTDANGHFKIQINAGTYTTSGLKTIDIQATDQSGTRGNIASLTFNLELGAPIPPAGPKLDPGSDTGTTGDNTTKDNNGPNPAPVLDVSGNGAGANVTLDRAPLAFSSQTPILVPDNASITSTINVPVSALASPYETLSSLTLNLSPLNYPTPQNLSIVLTGPDGTTIPVPAPYGSSISLAGLNGKLAAGNYKLTILNTGAGGGTFGGWSLSMTGNSPVDIQAPKQVVGAVPAKGTLVSTITIPASALPDANSTVGGLALDLSSLQFMTPGDLALTLKGPDGTTIAIPAPYGTNVLTGLNGKLAAGTYTLSITNSGTNTGWLGAWAISLNALSSAPQTFSATQSPAIAVPPSVPVSSTVTIPVSSLANPNATIPGLVLDLSKLSIPNSAKLSILLTGPNGKTFAINGPYNQPIVVNSFNGTSAAGVYTLSITNLDPTGQNVGSLGGWTLALAGATSTSTGLIAAGATATSTVTIPASALPSTEPQPSIVIPAQGSITTTLFVPASSLTSASATLKSLMLNLASLKIANPSNLTITLTGPGGQTVVVPAPYGNSINLAGLIGTQAAGTYSLTIANTGGTAGTLGAWSLALSDNGAGSTVKSFPLPTIADGVVLDLSQLSSPLAVNATITLTGPDGTVITVPGPFGRYVTLSGLNGKMAAGTYTLSITNNGASSLALGSWSLALPGTLTSTVAVNSAAASTTGTPPITVQVSDTNNGQGVIPDGVYLYTAAQSDLAGNLSQVGAGTVITIDATAPAPPAPTITTATDSGLPTSPRDGDAITNVLEPDFQGYVEANAAVLLFVNGVAAGTTTADATGHYLLTSTVALSQGLNNITIMVTDTVGNTSPASAPLVVRLDTSPPPAIQPKLLTSSDTGFSNSDGITYNSTPTFTGTAEVSPYLSANPTPLTDGALIRLYAQLSAPSGQQDTNPVFLIGEALADPTTGKYSVTVGQYITPQPADAVKFLADGTYNISAQQYDVAGNQSQSLSFGNAGAVVIDGTDSPLHGDNAGPGGADELGWLYMQKVFNLIQPNVTNGEKTLVGLGVNSTNGGGLVTSAIKSVFAQSNLPALGWNLVLVTGTTNIGTYLSGGSATALDVNGNAAGTISMSQTGLLYITTGNKLGDDLSNAELGVLDQHGTDIKNFVNSGGGLYAQTELPSDPTVKPFGWLTSLFPSITPVEQDGGTQGLQVTAAGQQIFPTATASDFNGAIWHNYFTGTFNPLSVIVTVPDPLVTGQIDPLVLASSGSLATTNPSQITVDTDGPDPKPTAAPVLDASTDSGVVGDGITQFNNGPSNVFPAPIFDVANVEAGAQVQLFRATFNTTTHAIGTPVLVNTVFNTTSASATIQIADTNGGNGTIADGTYIYTEQLTDVAGVSDAISAGTQITILATPPGTPQAITLDPTADSGTFNNDDVTNFNNSVANPSNAPLFDVTNVAAGLTVELFRGTKLVNTTASGAGGLVKVADTNSGGGTIADGNYLYHVQFVDVAGNISPVSPSLSVIIDHTAPAAPTKIVLDPSTDSGTLQNGGATNFNNNPANNPVNSPLFDVSGIEASATVQLFRATVVNGVAGTPVLVNTLTDTAGGTVQIADTNGGNGTIPNGTYVYTAKQIDLAGNTEATFSPGTTVIINATPPAAPPVRLDAASDTGISNSDGITQITLFHFPVFDISNVVAGGTVELFRNGKEIASQANTAGGTIQITDANSLADGVYTYAAVQIDLEGNASQLGTAIQVTYDTKAPIAPSAPVLDPSSDTGTLGDDITSATSPVFDLSGIETNATVKLLRDGVVVATVNFAAPVSGVLKMTDPGPIVDGIHTYTAFQTDLAGNVSPIGKSVQVTFQPDAPTGVALDPNSDSGIKGDNITNVTSPIIDVSGITIGNTVNLLRNGTVIATLTKVTSTTARVTDPGPLSSGQYVYTAQQVDPTGSTSSISTSVTITVMTAAQQPGIALDPGSDSGTQGDQITNVTNPTFDISSVSPGATVTLTQDGKVVATGTSSTGGVLKLQDTGPLTSGNYNFIAQQTDVAGNVSPLSGVLVLTIDTTLPPAPTLALDPSTNSGSKTDTITSSTQPIIDLAGIQTGATVLLYRGGTLIHTFTNVSTSTLTYTEPIPLTLGSYTYTATQTDTVGNLSLTSAGLKVTIDNSVPGKPTVALDPSSATNGSTTTNQNKNVVFDVSGVVAGGVVTLFRDGVAVGTAVSQNGGTVQVVDPGRVSAGQHTYTAQQTSGAGVVGAVSSPGLNITVLPVETVLGDYAGGGYAQFALYRRDTSTGQGTWFIPNVTSTSGLPFGSATLDVPVQGDFLGTGKDQIAIYRPSTATWYIPGYTPANGIQYGKANDDIPVPGDYNGTGVAQLAVYRQSTGQWFVGGTPNAVITLGGQPGDIPIPGYYDGPGKLEEAIYRPSTGQWFIAGHSQPIQFGSNDPKNPDVPVPGNYDGTGQTELAVFRPSTDTWYVAGKGGLQFGGPGDIPVPGDYLGFGRDEIAVYRVGNPGTLFIAGQKPIAFGGPNDIPANAPYAYREPISQGSTFSTGISAMDFGGSAVSLSAGQGSTSSASKTSTSGSNVQTNSLLTPTVNRIRPQGDTTRHSLASLRQFISRRNRISAIRWNV